MSRFLSPHAQLITGDLRDRAAVASALVGVDVVFHQAGMVGNGQSMYELHQYIDVNAGGTAILMEEVLRRRDRVSRVIAASSMVVYGEGAYRCEEHGDVFPGLREEMDLACRRWEAHCPRCGSEVAPRATTEDSPLRPTSPYAISKRDAEELVLVSGRAHGVATVALRYLNIYGPRQALSNPYTGVAALFCTRLLGGRRPLVFEDGGQLRDLTHVSDIVRANLLALDAPGVVGRAINVGTGTPLAVADLATQLAHALGRVDLPPDITGEYRAGDVRHCWADDTVARTLLDYRAITDRRAGLSELAEWVMTERPVDRTEQAIAELRRRGLVG